MRKITLLVLASLIGAQLFAQVSMVSNINSGTSNSSPQYLCEYQGDLYFGANNGTAGAELMKYNGTSVSLVQDIYSGSTGSYPTQLTVMGTNLYFAASSSSSLSTSLRKYNGTTVSSISGSPSYISEMIVFNGSLYFTGLSGSDYSLYKYTGSGSVTMVSGTQGISPRYFCEYNGSLYFKATSTNGTELGKITAADVFSMVADINTGSASSNPSYLCVLGNKLVFQATNSANGEELAIYDGTTVSFIDIRTGSVGSSPQSLTVYNTSVIFSANNGSTGVEVFKYDGTSVSLVSDIMGGTGSSNPDNYYVSNGIVFFQASDGSFTPGSGSELWTYDDNSGVSLLADINVGTGGSSPAYFEEYSGKIYFQAYTAAVGSELFKFECEAPSITSQPQAISVCEGSAASVSVGLNGSAPFTYNWYKDGVLQTNSSNSISFASMNNSYEGYYKCIVSNSCGTVTTDSVYIDNKELIVIDSLLVPDYACDGLDLILNVDMIGGGPLTFSWRKSGIEISTDSSANLGAADASMAGFYSVWITNSCGTVFSATKQVQFTTAPAAPVVFWATDKMMSSYVTGNQWYDIQGEIQGEILQAYTPPSFGDYHVFYTSPLGCRIQSNIFSYPTDTTAIDENNNDFDFSIYPNPAENVIRLNTSLEGDVEINVFNITGINVYNTNEFFDNNTNFALDISNLNDGVYFITLSSQGNKTTRKFIKK